MYDSSAMYDASAMERSTFTVDRRGLGEINVAGRCSTPSAARRGFRTPSASRDTQGVRTAGRPDRRRDLHVAGPRRRFGQDLAVEGADLDSRSGSIEPVRRRGDEKGHRLEKRCVVICWRPFSCSLPPRQRPKPPEQTPFEVSGFVLCVSTLPAADTTRSAVLACFAHEKVVTVSIPVADEIAACLRSRDVKTPEVVQACLLRAGLVNPVSTPSSVGASPTHTPSPTPVPSPPSPPSPSPARSSPSPSPSPAPSPTQATPASPQPNVKPSPTSIQTPTPAADKTEKPPTVPLAADVANSAASLRGILDRCRVVRLGIASPRIVAPRPQREDQSRRGG